MPLVPGSLVPIAGFYEAVKAMLRLLEFFLDFVEGGLVELVEGLGLEIFLTLVEEEEFLLLIYGNGLLDRGEGKGLLVRFRNWSSLLRSALLFLARE